MSWKKLHSRSSARSTKPAIGIQKNGRISWNEGTQQALQSPQFVELLYDEANKRLGLQKAPVEGEDTFVVRQASKQRTWGISALGALRSIGIEIKQAYRKAAQVEEGVVFIVMSDLEVKN